MTGDMAGPICSKCDLEMRPGFVPDLIYAGVRATVWHPGAPTKRKGLAKLVYGSQDIEYEAGRVLALEAWRCYGCGRVEFFAGRPAGK